MSVWVQTYKLGLKAPVGTKLGTSIVSVKKELVYNGVAVGAMNVEVPEVGPGTVRAIKDFQRMKGLTVDGDAGPITCAQLWKKRIRELEIAHKIETNLMRRMVKLESWNDPMAISPDGHDHSLVQIRDLSHPTVKVPQQAYDAEFNLTFGAKAFGSAIVRFQDMDVALAAHNLGNGGAAVWQREGKPQFKADGVTETAGYRYVRVVRAQVL